MLPSVYLLSLLLVCMHTNFNHARRRKVKHPSSHIWNISHHSSKAQNWDLLLFAQQWPITGCEQWRAETPSRKCSMPSVPNTWGIHGIWPSKHQAFGPLFCNHSADFDLENVRPIEDHLKEVWTTYKYGRPNYSFWAYEWTKHGTCAAVLEDFNTPLKYFNKGLQYYKICNLSKILSQANIVPSLHTAYEVEDIFNAIRFELGVKPVVKCKNINNRNYLSEIGVCFTKESRLCDCGFYRRGGARNDVLTDCDRGQSVLYIPYNSSD